MKWSCYNMAVLEVLIYMTKAIFLSYTGVVIPRRGNEYRQFIDTLVKNSNLRDYEHAAKWFTETLRTYKCNSSSDDYVGEENLIRQMFEDKRDEIRLSMPIEKVLVMVQNCLIYSPISDELAGFLALSRRPVYIISDCACDYTTIEMKRNHLHIHGTFSCDSVQAYRNYPQIFEYALQKAGVKKEEALYIGEDAQLDLPGARQAGITSVILDRRGDYQGTEFRRIRSLSSLLANLGE